MRTKGVSFIEILVVIAIFAILGVLVARITVVTLRSSNKSDSLVKVRENMDFSLAVMERGLRNATAVVPCPNPDTTVLNYVDSEGVSSSYSCVNVGPAGYVASGSARLTTDEIKIISCSISCSQGSAGTNPEVTISLEAADVRAVGIEGARATATTKIFLRTY
jgi:prepilin-type N-terminal cleavage/methylation domain-containing protein